MQGRASRYLCDDALPHLRSRSGQAHVGGPQCSTGCTHVSDRGGLHTWHVGTACDTSPRKASPISSEPSMLSRIMDRAARRHPVASCSVLRSFSALQGVWHVEKEQGYLTTSPGGTKSYNGQCCQDGHD